MTDAFTPLLAALQSNQLPPFEWAVEFADNAAIAKGWRAHRAPETACALLCALRGSRAAAWLAAAVATSAADRVRTSGSWSCAGPWVREVAKIARVIARDGRTPAIYARLIELSRDPYAGAYGSLALQAVQEAWHVLLVPTEQSVFVMRNGVKNMKPVNRWLCHHAPPPTWAEIRKHLAKSR